MKQNNLNIDDITLDAIDLENAIKGLSSFVYYNFSTENIKVEDISALSGLLASIKLLATKHAMELSDYGV